MDGTSTETATARDANRMLNEPSDREGSDREVYRDAMVLVGFVVSVVALPAIYLALA